MKIGAGGLCGLITRMFLRLKEAHAWVISCIAARSIRVWVLTLACALKRKLVAGGSKTLVAIMISIRCGFLKILEIVKMVRVWQYWGAVSMKFATPVEIARQYLKQNA